MSTIAFGQSVVCNENEISHYSNDRLTSIVGSDWSANYFYINFTSNEILYPENLNIVNVSKDSFFITTFYNFYGPNGLNASTTFTFILQQNSAYYCSQLILFRVNNLVEPYNLSQIIKPQVATAIANQHNFKVSYSSLSLVPSNQNNATYSFLVPGYLAEYNGLLVYTNAINSEVYSMPVYQPLNSSTDSPSFSEGPILIILILVIIAIFLFWLRKRRNK